MKNIATIFAALSLLIAMTGTDAHDGAINSCGGHTNNETGEYHLHDYKKYRACLSREEATKQAKRKMIFKCGNKSACNEMSNCKEATYYFEKCGLSELDSNKDGIPCDKLCQ